MPIYFLNNTKQIDPMSICVGNSIKKSFHSYGFLDYSNGIQRLPNDCSPRFRLVKTAIGYIEPAETHFGLGATSDVDEVKTIKSGGATTVV